MMVLQIRSVRHQGVPVRGDDERDVPAVVAPPGLLDAVVGAAGFEHDLDETTSSMSSGDFSQIMQ